MALDKHDLRAIDDIVSKRVVEGVGQALEEVVNPQLQELRDDVAEMKKDVRHLAGDVGEIATHIRLIEDSFALPKERRLKVSRSRL